mgnify:CR=1 FL=1
MNIPKHYTERQKMPVSSKHTIFKKMNYIILSLIFLFASYIVINKSMSYFKNKKQYSKFTSKNVNHTKRDITQRYEQISKSPKDIVSHFNKDSSKNTNLVPKFIIKKKIFETSNPYLEQVALHKSDTEQHT